MDERDITAGEDVLDRSESKALLPHCVSTFQDQLSSAWGSKSNPKVELRADSAVSAVSSRLEKLGEGGKSNQRYILKGEVGRGGMGAILKIHDPDLRRDLAMKVVLGKSVGTSGSARKTEANRVLRFIEEAQITGQLDHPGVLPVHEIGVDSHGKVYFTMRLVKGDELSTVIDAVHGDDPEWNMTRALGVFLKVCEAMSYAHERGVVHRDLKPANVMVGQHGAVYVMDWGLARVEGHEDSHDLRPQDLNEPSASIRTDRNEAGRQDGDSPIRTLDGTVMGTPFYMPPEQAAGRLDDIGPYSDVYSLGAMLYQLLTGRMPYHAPGETPHPYKVLTQVLAGPPQSINELTPDVSPELVSICEKAMAHEMTSRYRNMSELAADLRAYLENRVVQAHRSGAVIELKKWVQRNKALAAMILAFVVLSVGGSTTAAIVFGAKNETIRIARDDALSEAERASLAEVKAQKRAEELQQVADFQEEQLNGLDVELMGVRMRKALIDAAPADRRGELTLSLAGLNFTNLALGTLKDNLFDRTILAIDSQFDTQPLVQAQLLQSVASTLEALGLLSTAIDPQTRALAIRRSKLEDDHFDVYTSVNNMGGLLQSMGEFDAALPYYTEALEGRRRLLGDDHPFTLTSVNNVGSVLVSLGKTKDGLPYLNEALGGRRRVLGDDHPDTLDSMINLGYLLEFMGKTDDALPYFIEALERDRRVLGNDHPKTLMAMSSMGYLLKSMGKYEDALPYFIEGLEGTRRALGDDHPDTLTSVNNTGALLNSWGRYEEALPYFTEALSGKRRVLGDAHPATLISVNNMGTLLRFQAKYEAALPYFTEALEGNLQALGEDHPNTLKSVANMGNVLVLMDEFEKAMPYCTRALEGRRQLLGEDHPDTLASLDGMGYLLEHMGQFEKALPYYSKALEGRRMVLGKDHPDTLESLDNMGYLLNSMGNHEDALPYFTEVLLGRRRALGGDHLDTLRGASNMGLMLMHLGKYEHAFQFFTEALEGKSRVLGDDHTSTTESRTSLQTLYKRWCEKLSKEHGEDHPLTLSKQRDWANFLASSNQTEEAEVLLLDCLDRRLEVSGEEHPDTLQAFHDLATLYSQQDRIDESEGMYLECLALRDSALGESDPKTLESLEGLARLYSDNGRWKEAAPLAQRLLSLTPEESPDSAGRQQLLQLIESNQND